MEVPFKVFTFWGEGGRPEVRRFGIERSMVTSFLYLNAKLQEIYPGLKDKTYTVNWKDEEGDDVTVSSDNEMIMALTAMSGDLMKLYIHCKEEETKNEDDCDIVFTAVSGAGSGKNAVHYGVMCDGCDSSVVGFRYKCTTCDDFDLCSKCEAAGMHPEHCMVRVPMPTMPRTVIKAAIKRSRHFLRTVAGAVGEECPFKKHRRDRSGDRRHHGGEHHGPHGGEHHGPHGGEHHRGERHHRRQRSSWLETFATYMNEFANLAGDIDLDATKKAEPGTSQSHEQQKTSAENAEAPKQPEQGTSGDRPQCPIFPGPLDVQKLIESYLNGQLDFSAFIPKPQPAPSPANSTDASVNTNVDTNNASVDTNDDDMGQGDRQSSDVEKVSIKSEASHSSNESKRDESPDKAEGWTMINKEKDLMDAYMKPTAPSELATPIGFNLPEEFQERVRISEGQNLYPPLNAATAVLNPKEPERPIVVEQPTPPQPQPQQLAEPLKPTQAQPSPPQAQQMPPQAQQMPPQAQQMPPQAQYMPPQAQYMPQQTKYMPQWAQHIPPQAQQKPPQAQPKPPQAQQKPPQAQQQPQPRQRHPQAHIDAAIEQMLMMGFTNDGGWLTQLLESKDGNIAAVLDLLTPVNPKQN